jgi:nucleotide-binding universal stress UspA family protein
MNILSTLVRLEDALGRTNLSKQMVLLTPISPEEESPVEGSPAEGKTNSGDRRLGARLGQAREMPREITREINLVVGYNGSPNSQTALDLTLWIAHQTRLATRHQVTVQVVYVVDLEKQYAQEAAPLVDLLDVVPAALEWLGDRPMESIQQEFQRTERQPGRAVVSGAVAELPAAQVATGQIPQIDQFDYADRVLWQARQMADEWRGSLKTHLRFGNVAQELRRVVNAESASVLLLGCTSAENRVVEELGLAFPCTVLGIPPAQD